MRAGLRGGGRWAVGPVACSGDLPAGDRFVATPPRRSGPGAAGRTGSPARWSTGTPPRRALPDLMSLPAGPNREIPSSSNRQQEPRPARCSALRAGALPLASTSKEAVQRLASNSSGFSSVAPGSRRACDLEEVDSVEIDRPRRSTTPDAGDGGLRLRALRKMPLQCLPGVMRVLRSPGRARLSSSSPALGARFSGRDRTALRRSVQLPSPMIATARQRS